MLVKLHSRPGPSLTGVAIRSSADLRPVREQRGNLAQRLPGALRNFHGSGPDRH